MFSIGGAENAACFTYARDLEGWALDRWASVEVSTDTDGTRATTVAEISPEANHIARDSYCQLIRDAKRKHLPPGQSWIGSLTVLGETVRTCV